MNLSNYNVKYLCLFRKLFSMEDDKFKQKYYNAKYNHNSVLKLVKKNLNFIHNINNKKLCKQEDV